VFATTNNSDPVFDRAVELIKNKEVAHTFYVVDIQAVHQRTMEWEMELPSVRMHFTVRTNNDETVLKELVKQGCGFDCQSFAEMEQVLALGAQPADVILSHPAKLAKHIQFAKERGIKLLTFDCAEEAARISKIHPEAELVFLVATEKNQKFGASEANWKSILQTCLDLNMKVRGVSFHVTSKQASFEAYEAGLKLAQKAFELAEELNMPAMDLLDIVGDFTDLPSVGTQIQAYLEEEFPGP